MTSNRAGITVLDGGMGKELHRIGAPFRQPEWSALALMEAPARVTEAHRNFIAAGAEVITVNSYALVGYHIGEDGFAERGRELADLAGRLARDAADSADREVRVAGSLPPLFGSYLPENFRPEVAPDQWRVLAEAQAPYVDLWIGETIGSVAEAETIAAVVAGVEADKPAPSGTARHELWLSFTLDDEFGDDGQAVLYSGESVTAAGRVAAGLGDAVLFNCVRPEVMAPALRELVEAIGPDGLETLQIGVYANAFPARVEQYAPNSVIYGRRDDLTPEAHLALATHWHELGATLIGGCCGSTPSTSHRSRHSNNANPTSVEPRLTGSNLARLAFHLSEPILSEPISNPDLVAGPIPWRTGAGAGATGGRSSPARRFWER